MPVQDTEALRLATQRTDDLTALHERELARERERGAREERERLHTEDQDRHLAVINGSIEGFRRELAAVAEKASTETRAVAKQVSDLEVTVGKFIAVTEALEQKGVSTKTFVLGVLALLVPVLILVVTLAVTGQ
jgi:hypothetical protein